MTIIGIDLGGTIVKLGILQDGKLSSEREIPVPDNQSLKKNIPAINEEIIKMIADAGTGNVDGMGLAFPGQVDSRNMKVLRTTKYLDAPDFDFRGWARDNWDCTLVMDNDSRMACIGEWKYGAGKDCRNMLMVTLGTGIGSGVILEDKILYGKNFRAGNLIGHTIVDYKGENCQCGNRGCAEATASTWSLQKFIRNDPGYEDSKYKDSDDIDFRRLFRDSQAGDDFAGRIIGFCMEIWSAAITNLVNDFDPERVVLGGGIMGSADIVLPLIREKVLSRSWSTEEEIEFRKAALGNHASFWGGQYLLSLHPGWNANENYVRSGQIHR